LAAHLLSALKQKISVLELEPSGGGCFEVHVDGRLVHSKLKTGEYPENDAVLKAIGGAR
jgi:selenoprotein W-related protein